MDQFSEIPSPTYILIVRIKELHFQLEIAHARELPVELASISIRSISTTWTNNCGCALSCGQTIANVPIVWMRPLPWHCEAHLSSYAVTR